MATRKQVEANRRNAERSTGPRTEAGKASSRLNAVRHGILARTLVVPNLEHEEDWEAHRDGWWATLQPVGSLEEFLAERVIELSWRIRRVGQYERDEIAKAYSSSHTSFFKEREARHELGGLQLPSLARLDTISRYEAHIHRSFLQSLHELQRAQARRQDGDPAVPAAVDVVLTNAPIVTGGRAPHYQTNPLPREGDGQTAPLAELQSPGLGDA